MSKALETALAHFAKRKNSTLEIPEWGLTVHYSPLGLLEREKAVPRADSTPDEVAHRMAKVVIEHAKDEKGEPLFGPATPELVTDIQHKIEPSILQRIALAIIGTPSEAQAAKN